MHRRFLCLLLGAANFSFAGDHHWEYSGSAGPDAWGNIAPEFVECARGHYQSPINIEGAMPSLHPPLAIDYTREGKEIVNNGHTVQINFPSGNNLRLEDGVYELKQVHFHTPSENRIEGKSYPLEAHFVHADAQNNFAVIAVMFEKGQFNGALQRLWTQLPGRDSPAVALQAAVSAKQLMPPRRDYYRFSGSLTTPPCTEGVRWIVLKEPVAAAKEQIKAFETVMGHHNSRPLQPRNGRIVIQ